MCSHCRIGQATPHVAQFRSSLGVGRELSDGPSFIRFVVVDLGGNHFPDSCGGYSDVLAYPHFPKELAPIRSASCPPDTKSSPTCTLRTILWLMWAKCVFRTVLPSPASKLLYSARVRSKASLTSAKYSKKPVLW